MTPQIAMTQPFSFLRRSLSALSIFAALSLVGCASSAPDIPEDSETSSNQYQSTSGESDSASQSSNSESSTANQSTAQNRRLTTGSPQSSSSSQSKDASMPKATGPVAHVNGEPISAEKFNDQVNKLSKSRRITPRQIRRIAPRLIDKLVDQRLVENYIAKQDVDIADERVEKRLEEVRKQFERANKGSQGNIKTLEDARSQMGISDKQLRDSIRQSLAIEEVLTTKRGVQLPTDEELRTFYDNNQKRFQQPERVRASHIIVKVPRKKRKDDKAWKKAKKRAQTIYKKVKNSDKDFSALAKKHSEGPTAEKGGDLGYFTKQGLRGLGDFANTVFNMKNGELSEPVKSRYGWHIIKRTGHKPAGTVPFEEVKGQIRKRMKNKKLKQELQTLVQDLRDEAEIEKHPDNIS